MATPTLSLPWTDLLAQEGVEYVERGPNVARNHINIHCPWCGPADPSHHLGISLEGKGWGCWRSPLHRGRSPARLLFKLLGDRAKQYLPQPTQEELLVTPQLPSRFALTACNAPVEVEEVDHKTWDAGFRFTHRITRQDIPFLEYLTKTRFLKEETVIRQGLRVAQYGPMAWRIFCPIRYDHLLLGWTARTMGSASPRYIVGPGRVDTLNMIRTPVGDAPVVLIEGYFDGLRLYECCKGEAFGIGVLHGTALSAHKAGQLKQLSQHHPLIFALDNDAEHLAMTYSLHFDGFAVPPPVGRKDLGEATDGEILSWTRKLSLN